MQLLLMVSLLQLMKITMMIVMVMTTNGAKPKRREIIGPNDTKGIKEIIVFTLSLLLPGKNKNSNRKITATTKPIDQPTKKPSNSKPTKTNKKQNNQPTNKANKTPEVTGGVCVWGGGGGGGEEEEEEEEDCFVSVMIKEAKEASR